VRKLPSLDLHAHVDAAIDPIELTALDAVVFAVTRSLDEAAEAVVRTDPTTIWGVGCHPGLLGAQKAFDEQRFERLIQVTPFVGEIGLDGNSRVSMALQQNSLDMALSVLARSPRITSLHSYQATAELLEIIQRNAQPGLILHWWLGSVAETQRAVELGCYFSVNRASVRRIELLEAIPLLRVLPETDHPFGDKGSGLRRPGEVRSVEDVLGETYDLSADAMRGQMWANLAELVTATGVGHQLGANVRRILASV